MNRYIVVNEFFGIRVFDTELKNQLYFSNEQKSNIMKLIKGNYEILNEKFVPNGRRLSAPLKISMNITKGCNLRCKQCFSNSAIKLKDELTTEEIYRLFDKMAKYGTFFICIGGGEPLTRSDIMDILAYGKKKRLAISVVTNGTLVNAEIVSKLNEMDLDTLWISFDGLKESHELLRGKGTFAKAIQALENLKNFNAKVAIRVSISKNNIKELADIVKIAEEYEVDIIRFTPLMEFGRAKEEDIIISQRQYIDCLKELDDIESKVRIITPSNIENDKFWVSSSEFGCHCGKEAIWIDEQGYYSPCFFYGEEFFIGNIKKDSYLDLWDESNRVTNFKGNDICKNCSNYSKCRGGCRARAYMAYNNFDDVDPLCPLRKNAK